MKIDKNNNPYIGDNDFENKLRRHSYIYPGKFQDVWNKMTGRTHYQAGFNRFKLIGKTAAAGIAGILVLVFLWAGFSIREKPGIMTLADGDVQIRNKPDEKWRKALLNDAIGPGSEIRTTTNGKCMVKMNGKALMAVLPSSDVRINILRNKSGQVRLLLDKGEIAVKYFHTAGSGSNEYFTVWTSTAEAGVTGTKFIIGIDDNGDTKVSVSEGTVSFQPRLESLEKSNLKLDKNEMGILSKNLVRTIPVSSNESAAIPASKVRDLDKALEKNISALKNENNIIINPENILEITNRLKQQVIGVYQGVHQEKISGKELLKLNTIIFDMNMSLSNLKIKEPAGSDINKENTNVPPASLFLNKNCLAENNYYMTERNILKILDPGGRIIREIKVSDSPIMLSKPAFDGKLIYLGSDNGGLYAYSRIGEPVWKVLDAGQVKFNAFPIAGKGIVVLPTSDKGIEVYNVSGKLLYQIPLDKDEAVYAAPLLLDEDSLLIYGTEKGKIACYDLSAGKENWNRNDFGDRIIYPLIGDGNTAVVLSRNTGNLQAFNPKTGDVLWQKVCEELKKTDLNPLFLDGKIFAAAGEKTKAVVLIIDGKTGRILKRKTFGEPIFQPVIWKGKILIYTQSGRSQFD